VGRSRAGFAHATIESIFMCGRIFEIYTSDDLAVRYDVEVPVEVAPTYNLCPTEESPVVRVAEASRIVERMRWQLVPGIEPAFSTKLSTINARSEGVFTSRLYGPLISRQRCIVPISGFYEWKREGTARRPFKISLRADSIMSVAGIWDTWRAGTKDERHSFTILTTTANERMQPIHDRMPVILSRDNEEAWLDPKLQDGQSVRAMLKPCPSDWLEATEVSSLVNAVKNNSPDLLRPVADSSRADTLFDLY
jgi:putative SOS response-associated peptidase YedK